MVERSCLYECRVMHNRLQPVSNKFVYKIFMFWLDLDEIDSLAKRILFMSRNRFNVFSFRDRDHIVYTGGNVKESILGYLKDKNIHFTEPRIFLLTNLAFLGYNFNPVSFFYCFDGNRPVCAVAEVSNTFREVKYYLLDTETFRDNAFRLRTVKYFYVSPFIDHDAEFDFNLKIPGDKLEIVINDYKNGNKFFLTALIGHKQPLTNGRLLWYCIRFPFITLQVIGLIHWQALKLWRKKLPYFRKADYPELQREVYNVYQS